MTPHSSLTKICTTVAVLAMLLSSIFLGFTSNVNAQTSSGIVQLYTPTTYTATGTFITGTLPQVPTEGNLLVATFTMAYDNTPPRIYAFTQDNVNWTKAVDSNSTNWVNGIFSNYNIGASIYIGEVGAGASALFNISTISIAETARMIIAEYSGVSAILDGYANNTAASGITTSTGSITPTTAPQLWVGAVVVHGDTDGQDTPQNGFALVNGSVYWGSVLSGARLEKISYVTEQAVSGTTITNSHWAGCIIALQATEAATYTIYGPYLETGEVYHGVINVTASFVDSAPTTVTMNGTSGVAQVFAVPETYQLVSLFWNITSTYDRQRTIMVREGDSEFYLYVPSSEDVAYQCSVGITDFAGLSGGHAQILRNIGGTNQIVMQLELDINSAMPFWLIYYAQYDFRIISDQGTFTWGLPADGVTSKTFTVTYDMISHAYTGGNFTISASRSTAENITVSYVDNSGNTSSVTTVIKHLEQGSYVTDFTQTDEASTQSFSWTEAKASINYVVTITATIAGEEVVWQYGLSSTLESDYWNGFFDLFGAFPFPATQLIGIVIGALFFCVGNWRDIEAFTALGVIVTAILAIIGWVTVPTLGLGASFLVVVFMYLSKGKKENPYA